MSKIESDACAVIGKTPIRREDLLLKGITRGIYGLKNKITGKWYVGQSWDISMRWRVYKNLNCPNQRKLSHTLKKYGWESFDSYLLEEIICPSQIMLDRLECYWMDQLNSINDGYNLRGGGSRGKLSQHTKDILRELNLGKKASDETRNKLRIVNKRPHSNSTKEKLRQISLNHPTLNDRIKNLANMKVGKPRSESTKQKLREAHIGKVRSAEDRLKISLGQTGRVLSEATKKKISDSMKKRLRP